MQVISRSTKLDLASYCSSRPRKMSLAVEHKWPITTTVITQGQASIAQLSAKWAVIHLSNIFHVAHLSHESANRYNLLIPVLGLSLGIYVHMRHKKSSSPVEKSGSSAIGKDSSFLDVLYTKSMTRLCT